MKDQNHNKLLSTDSPDSSGSDYTASDDDEQINQPFMGMN
jgi:hypothetical protein